MKPLDEWLNEYALDHQNPRNQLIHRICVPAIFAAVVGGLHLIPLNLGPFLVGDLVLTTALCWYASLGTKAFLLMVIQVFVAVALVEVLHVVIAPVPILVAVFFLAWVGQFWGHHLEGKRPSFLKDLQYLLIGPLWVWLGKHHPEVDREKENL